MATSQRRRDELRALLRDVAASGVEHDDPRNSYVLVQIDRRIWTEVLMEVLAEVLAPAPIKR